MAALLAVCAACLLAVPARAADPPTVSVAPATAITTTGALVSVTVNAQGNATLYRLSYGPSCDQLTTTTPYQDAGSGTTDVTQSFALDALAPSTTYCYRAEIFQNATQADVMSNTSTFTTAANPTGPGTPITAPQPPPDNGIFSGNCQTDAQCLADINGTRASQEQLPPIALPNNWNSLSGAQKLFVAFNLERVSRGLAAIPSLVSTYNREVQIGINNNNDPDLSDQNAAWGWESIWAGSFPTVMGAMYGWEYNDGYHQPAINLDCTSPTAQGCWGHRQAVLDNPKGILSPTEVDAIAGVDQNGAPTGYAAAFTNNPAPSNVIFTWAQEQPFLAPPTLGGLGPRGPRPQIHHLVLDRSRFRALGGRGRYRGRTVSFPQAPTVELNPRLYSSFGTVVSYRDSQAATSMFKIQRTIVNAQCVRRAHRRHRSAARCTIYFTLGSFSHADVRGTNRFRLTGRLNGAQLKPGSYRLTLTPRGVHGRRGSTVARTFRIVR